MSHPEPSRNPHPVPPCYHRRRWSLPSLQRLARGNRLVAITASRYALTCHLSSIDITNYLLTHLTFTVPALTYNTPSLAATVSWPSRPPV